MKRLLLQIYGRRELFNGQKVFCYYRDENCTQLVCRDPYHYHRKDQIVVLNCFKYSLKVLKSHYA